jgi:hypothetical protein
VAICPTHMELATVDLDDIGRRDEWQLILELPSLPMLASLSISIVKASACEWTPCRILSKGTFKLNTLVTISLPSDQPFHAEKSQGTELSNFLLEEKEAAISRAPTHSLKKQSLRITISQMKTVSL